MCRFWPGLGGIWPGGRRFWPGLGGIWPGGCRFWPGLGRFLPGRILGAGHNFAWPGEISGRVGQDFAWPGQIFGRAGQFCQAGADFGLGWGGFGLAGADFGLGWGEFGLATDCPGCGIWPKIGLKQRARAKGLGLGRGRGRARGVCAWFGFSRLVRRNRRCWMLPFACMPWHRGVWYVSQCWILPKRGRMSGFRMLCFLAPCFCIERVEHNSPNHFSSRAQPVLVSCSCFVLPAKR